MTIRRAVLVPLAALATGACATRSDVRVLQNDLSIMRAESAQADSARRAQLERVIAELATVRDTLRVTSTRLTRFQGDAQGALYSLQQQLIQVQELTGQSQRRLQELRAGLEAGGAGAPFGAPPVGDPSVLPPAGAPPAAPPAGAAAGSASAAPPGAPGPNQLFQLSVDQLRRGSAGAARAGFEELIRLYPTSDVAPEAQFYIGEAYAAEGNMTAADSAYALVGSRYPDSPRAPTALYKYAASQERAGRAAEARRLFDTLVKKYPRSDEAELARERLRSPR